MEKRAMSKTYRRDPYASSLKEGQYQPKKIPLKRVSPPEVDDWDEFDEHDDDLQVDPAFDDYREYLERESQRMEKGISDD